MTKRATWTAEDTALFIKHYPDSTEAELVELFGGRYTVKQIRDKRHNENVRKSPAYRASENWRRANYRPIGSTRLSSDGYMEVKAEEGRNRWKLLHREVWKKHHGSYPPKGHVIVFVDGNTQNCDISNLKLITRAELMQRNIVHNLPKYLAELIQLNGQLKRKINERR